MVERPLAIVMGLFDTGLGAVRSLGRAGVRVLGIDSDRAMPGFASRYCHATACPDPAKEPEALVDALLEGGREEGEPGVLLPTSDVFVQFLSRMRVRLGGRFRFALPEADVVEAILDKGKQYELAASAGVPCPRTFAVKSTTEVAAVEGEIDYPAIVKPCVGQPWRQHFGGSLKGLRASNSAELHARCAGVFAAGLEVVVQSIVPGPNTNHVKVCACIGSKSQTLALFTLRKIRQYPTEFGVGSLVESAHDPELTELGMRFFRAISYHGIGSIEFKRDERDGQLKLIELNPRLWQQNALATACGINFPLIQYLDLTGQPVEPQTEFKAGVRWLDLMADFQAFLSYRRRGQLGLWRWMRSIVRARSFATFAWDDPQPFLKNYGYGLKLLRAPAYMARARSDR